MPVVKIELTPNDYVVANRLHSRGRVLRFIVGLLIGYAGVLAVLFTLNHDWPQNAAEWQNFGSGLVAVLFFGAVWLLIVRYVLLPWRSRRIYRQQKNLHQEFEYSWDESALTVTGKSGYNTTPWHDFLKWRESANMFLVYRSDIMFNMLPKRFFSDASLIDDFRSALETGISPIEGRRRKGG
jgi:hypothetical protein